MKITKQYLRKIIKEEIRNILVEQESKFKLVLDKSVSDKNTPYPSHAIHNGKKIAIQFSESRPTLRGDRKGSVHVTVSSEGETHHSSHSGDAFDGQRYVKAANKAIQEFLSGKRDQKPKNK
tara:strand:+ start:136 stop:498 length:363 start_codon:yes stop_codon:yes gene_type:complete